MQYYSTMVLGVSVEIPVMCGNLRKIIESSPITSGFWPHSSGNFAWINDFRGVSRADFLENMYVDCAADILRTSSRLFRRERTQQTVDPAPAVGWDRLRWEEEQTRD